MPACLEHFASLVGLNGQHVCLWTGTKPCYFGRLHGPEAVQAINTGNTRPDNWASGGATLFFHVRRRLFRPFRPQYPVPGASVACGKLGPVQRGPRLPNIIWASLFFWHWRAIQTSKGGRCRSLECLVVGWSSCQPGMGAKDG
ncbi:unnamed protein product [Protopolystoma xenopodis]|uniref:Uncharacterized protein n=1 Tax=Protopolystoma xenopodis TaxID=117903 RepID=A0A448WSP8_9PLAT|nr:unnamed protein product [Protopolystoma xenopodis]